jgi:molybdopterin/thiamine biosynthesis adenylyltransferase
MLTPQQQERHKRHTDILRPDEIPPIHIIGAGGIGSWTAVLLAKMGARDITVYDSDTVSDHNIACQLFREQDIDQLKTKALQTIVKDQSGIIIKEKPATAENHITDGLVIIALDTMARRQELAEMYKTRDIFIIDGRLGGLQAELYTTPADDWQSTLCDPADVQPDACTARTICFTCTALASLIANAVRQYAQGSRAKRGIIYGFVDNQQARKY